ncbi:MAG: ATP-binding protein [Candidatus Methanoplasma sp.]|jgi:AAA+ ATPase superfamily predicted ATPase|nr:ATP-binding protein [Candidatus Methanoplasma sp.]
MKKFYDGGRVHELRSLEELYSQKEFAFAVVYGRRRVGKTSLINEFVSRGDKKAIMFTATETPDIINLENFSHSVYAAIHPGFY